MPLFGHFVPLNEARAWFSQIHNGFNDESEKLAPRSRSFREVFVKFFWFSDVFESFRTCLDLFGYVRMRSDAAGCI